MRSAGCALRDRLLPLGARRADRLVPAALHVAELAHEEVHQALLVVRADVVLVLLLLLLRRQLVAALLDLKSTG